MLTLRQDFETVHSLYEGTHDCVPMGDVVVNVNGRDILSRATQLRLMRQIYPDALDQFVFVHDEDEVLLRPRVRQINYASTGRTAWKADARLSYTDSISHYVAIFDTWRVALAWALSPCRFICGCRTHTYNCFEVASRVAGLQR